MSGQHEIERNDLYSLLPSPHFLADLRTEFAEWSGSGS